MADLLTRVGVAVHGLRSGLVHAATGDHGIGATVSPSVIEPSELARRMTATRASQAAIADDVTRCGSPTLDARADRLHRLWATISPPAIERIPGLRGRVAFEAKRTIHRFTSWYVEHRWSGQHEVDAETARFASDVATQIADLRAHLEHLEERNDRLHSELQAFRRDQTGGR